MRHLPPPKTVHLPGGQLPPQFFFSFSGALSWLTGHVDIEDGKEEVLEEVVMEHIRWEVVVTAVMEDLTEEERSAELFVSVHGGLDHTFLKRGRGKGGQLSLFQTNKQSRISCCPLAPKCFRFVFWCDVLHHHHENHLRGYLGRVLRASRLKLWLSGPPICMVSLWCIPEYNPRDYKMNPSAQLFLGDFN